MKKDVKKLAEKLVLGLKPFCKKIQVAGSIRSKKENPFDIDIVLIPKNREKLEEFLKTKGRRIQGGEHESTWKIESVKVELYYTIEDEWGATLLAYSGEKGPNIGLRKIAKKKGFLLNNHGLFKNGKKIASKSETDIYHALGRHYKKPWNR